MKERGERKHGDKTNYLMITCCDDLALDKGEKDQNWLWHVISEWHQNDSLSICSSGSGKLVSITHTPVCNITTEYNIHLITKLSP